MKAPKKHALFTLPLAPVRVSWGQSVQHTADSAAEEATEWIPLFDTATLHGWHGPNKRLIALHEHGDQAWLRNIRITKNCLNTPLP